MYFFFFFGFVGGEKKIEIGTDRFSKIDNSFTEVLQDTFLEFFDSGKLKFASATSVRFSPDGFERFYNNWEHYKVRGNKKV